MSTSPEISSLFAALASLLQSEDPAARDGFDLSISNLYPSLNLSEAPRVRILDTALSLMCFTAPQVYETVAEFTVKTIVAVLSSSIECKVSRINNDHIFRVGGSISKSDCANVMEECADILEKLEEHKGDLCVLLSCSIIRVAALASASDLEMKFSDYSTSTLAKLIGYFPNEFTSKNGEIPIRLLLWHLDPMILKQDVSHILQEIIERPFLSLNMEIYNRIEWRTTLICLAISPSMFVETRSLLHKWFLMMGLASILEVQSEFVKQVLDIISRPMWWGISMEVGLKLPFSHAYFPHEHLLLRILAGPMLLESFQHLIRTINDPVSRGEGHVQTQIDIVDHKSMWSMVLNFPDWFFFASMLLFQNKDSNLEAICSTEAAKFIAWILYPASESNKHLVVDYLVKVSELWTQNCSSSEILTVALWLKDFKDLYDKIFGKKAKISTSKTKLFNTHQNLLLRRIPLGILLLSPNHLNSSGCSLLLHYAATGTIRKVPHFQDPGQSDSVMSIGRYTKAQAIAGCKTVFDITDVAESISSYMFETEEEGLNFIGQLKLKTCIYLLKCIQRLRQYGDEVQMNRDLLARVIRWRHQAKDVFENNNDLESVCDALNI